MTTQKENKIYVHVLNWNAPLLALPPIATKVSKAQALLKGTVAEFTQDANGIVLKLPPQKDDEVDRVIVLTLAR